MTTIDPNSKVPLFLQDMFNTNSRKTVPGWESFKSGPARRQAPPSLFPDEGEVGKLMSSGWRPAEQSPFSDDGSRLIFMGMVGGSSRPVPGESHLPPSERSNSKTPKPWYLTAGEAMSWWDSMPDKQRAKFTGDLKNLGLIGKNDGDMEARAKWEAYVKEAQTATAAGRTKYGPWEVLRSYGDPKKARMGAYTTTSFDLQEQTSSPLAAKAFINQALSTALGRDATDSEVHQLTKALNADERQHPLTRKTTTTHSGGGPYEDREVSSVSQTTGGFSDVERQQMLLDKAKQSDEYGAYQAVATYFPALLQALAGPVTG